MVAITGGYITYVHPRVLMIGWPPLVIRGHYLVLVDALFHQLPLAYLLWRWRAQPQPRPAFLSFRGVMLALALVFAYAGVQDLSRHAPRIGLGA